MNLAKGPKNLREVSVIEITHIPWCW